MLKNNLLRDVNKSPGMLNPGLTFVNIWCMVLTFINIFRRGVTEIILYGVTHTFKILVSLNLTLTR
jgi:hypothetical protein